MSDSIDSELHHFQHCSDLYGNRVRVTMGRRNGKTEAFLGPSLQAPSQASEPKAFEDNPKYYVNLNPLEQRTFRRILIGQSIASIAKEDGVNRSSIYARICGNSKGQGGMVAKSYWVLLWWRLRQKAENNTL